MKSQIHEYLNLISKVISKKSLYFLVLALLHSSNFAQNTITTIAGNGIAGYSGDGGQATSARLNQPSGVTTDAAGNIYIADNNNTIRKVDAITGIITTVAGTGIAGYSGDGGPATSAQLNFPFEVRADGPGNLYIADANNNVIRKVDVNTGIITTIAGTGVPGYSGDGGPATSALLNYCSGIALDEVGNIYISDDNNEVMRMINTAGIINTIAGNGTDGYSGDGGPATSASLSFPVGIQTDGHGNLYISDLLNSVVRKINTSGIITTVAGNGTFGYSGDGGLATSASLNGPFDVAFDAEGNYYISDYSNNRIRMVNTSGIISTFAGNGFQGFSGDGGSATSARLNQPTGTTIDRNGNLLIADWGNNRVRKVSLSAAPGLGSDCDNAISLNIANNNNNPLTLSNPSQSKWFSFTAASAYEYISMIGQTENSQNKISDVTVYQGSCSQLALIYSYTFTPLDSQKVNISLANLTQGNTYYIKINYASPYIGSSAVIIVNAVNDYCGSTIDACVILNEPFTSYNVSPADAYPFNNITLVGCWHAGWGTPQVFGPNQYAFMSSEYVVANSTHKYPCSGNPSDNTFPNSTGEHGESIYRNLPVPLFPGKQYVLEYDYQAPYNTGLEQFYVYVVPAASSGLPQSPNNYQVPSLSNPFVQIDNLLSIPYSPTFQHRSICFQVPFISLYTHLDQILLFPRTTHAGTGDCILQGINIKNIVIREVSPSATINTAGNCQGGGAQLGVTGCLSPDFTYSWAPGTALSCNNCPNPSALPSATTVYNLTTTFNSIPAGTGPTCVYTSAVTVHPPQNCCGTNVRGSRAHVSIPGGTSTAFTSSQTNTDFTVFNGGTIIVEAPTTFVSGVGPVPATNTAINFTGCTFLMYPGSKIVIITRNMPLAAHCVQTTTLTVNFNNSHLYGCEQLWEGISFAHDPFAPVSCNGDVSVMQYVTNLNINNSLVEDAYVAVDNTGIAGTISYNQYHFLAFTTTNSMYNKNYIDFSLDQAKLNPNSWYFPGFPSFSKNCSYTCRGSASSATWIYDPPFVPLPASFSDAFLATESYYASVLNSVAPQNIKPCGPCGIFSPSTSNLGIHLFALNVNSTFPQRFDLSTHSNIFDQHQSGVVSAGIDVILGQQHFHTISGDAAAAIGSVSGTGPATEIIGSSVSSANYFSNCNTGVHSYASIPGTGTGVTKQLTTNNNTFDNCITGIKIDFFGGTGSGTNCTIQNNTITNVVTNGILFNGATSINALVSNNSISAPNNVTSTAITVNEATPLASAKYDINSNNINSTLNGISCTGTYGAKINTNTIQLFTPPVTTPFTYNNGISEVNCRLNTISNNSIQGNNVGYSWGQYGVTGFDSPLSEIYCNNITGTNVGLNFAGPMPSHVYTNDIYNQTIDVWLSSSAVLGKQYNPITSIIIPPGPPGTPFPGVNNYQPGDNRYFWNVSTHLYSSYCTASTNGANSTFYIRAGYPYDMLTPFHDLTSFQMNPVYPSSPVPYTSHCTAHKPSNLGNGLMNPAHLIAVDSLLAPSDHRNIFVSRRALFANLIDNNITSSGDVAIDNFRLTHLSGNIGKFYKVDDYISRSFAAQNAGLIDSASSLNNSVVPADSLQLLQKQVNTAYTGFLKNNLSYNSGDITTLKNIAPLCPYTYGTAVWEARSLLSGIDGISYFNSCEAIVPPPTNANNRIAHVRENSAEENISSKIYPNPNSGSFNVDITGKYEQLSIDVYNMFGNLVLHKENTKNIIVDDLQDGVYFVKIKGNGVLLKTEKVLVTK